MADSPATRSRRYRARTEATKRALLMGLAETDVIAVFTHHDGYHVAVDSEGRRVELVVRAASEPKAAPLQAVPQPLAPVTPIRPVGHKVPLLEEWAPGEWQALKAKIAEAVAEGASRADVIDRALNHAADSVVARIVQQTSDTPDWFDELPD